MTSLPRWPGLAVAASLLVSFPSFAADLLTPGEPILLTGTHGKFDFLAVDVANRRLLAAHTGNASLDVLDLDRHAIVKIVPTGAAQSTAVDEHGDRYYVSVSKPPQVFVLDSSTLEPVGKVPLGGPADISAFDARTGQLFVGHDDARELWIVEPAAQKVVGHVELPGEGPEDLAFDTSFERLFQAIKASDLIAVIDPKTGRVTGTFPTAPAKAPHGIAMVPEAEAILVAGGNGKLVLMSQKDGHILASTAIPLRVDQIAYDPGTHRVYCASGTGKISVASVEKTALSSLGEVPSSEGCHSIAVDPKTHTVWVAYARVDASYVQAFAEAK